MANHCPTIFLNLTFYFGTQDINYKIKMRTYQVIEMGRNEHLKDIDSDRIINFGYLVNPFSGSHDYIKVESLSAFVDTIENIGINS